MSITSVYPPSTTPGGWFGCFGPPSIVATNVPVAWPVSGQLPCGNKTVESCCIIGDQCLSNGVCQIMPVANNGQDSLYYGAYCTDPTFSSPECAANCAVKYMAYCGYNDLWQCGDTDRTNLISCNTSDATTSDSSTFFMIEPTKLAKGSILPSTEPTTTQTQYIPTQWGKPEAAISATSVLVSPLITSTIASLPTTVIVPSLTTSTTASLSLSSGSTTALLTSSSPTSSSSSSNSNGLTAGADTGIAIAGLVVAIVGVSIAWKQYRKRVPVL